MEGGCRRESWLSRHLQNRSRLSHLTFPASGLEPGELDWIQFSLLKSCWVIFKFHFIFSFTLSLQLSFVWVLLSPFFFLILTLLLSSNTFPSITIFFSLMLLHCLLRADFVTLTAVLSSWQPPETTCLLHCVLQETVERLPNRQSPERLSLRIFNGKQFQPELGN